MRRIVIVFGLGAAVLQGGRAAAGELGSVLEQRLTLERGLANAVNATLEHLLGRKRAFATVSVELHQEILNKTSLAGNARAMSFTVGTVSSEKYLKLPGLPRMRPGKIAEPVRIRIDPKKKKVVSTKVVGVVKRIRVRLYVDPKLDDARVTVAERAVREAAGLDEKRGDTLTVERMAVAGSAPVAVALKPEESVDWFALAIPLSVVFASLVLGLALWQRRRGAGSADGGVMTERISRRDELGGPRAVERAPDTSPEAARLRERGARYLPNLTEVHTGELVALLGALEARDAELVLALAPLSASQLAAVVDRLAAEQPTQARTIASLAQQRDVEVAQIAALAKRVDEGLERVRNPDAIVVGAPERLGQILRVSSRATTRSVLACLDEDQPELGAAVRRTLMQFEDLPALPPAVLRRLVAAIDPTVLATALVGVDARSNDAVRAVLSARLERILREEQQALGKHTPEVAIEQAREEVQKTLNQLEREAAHA